VPLTLKAQLNDVDLFHFFPSLLSIFMHFLSNLDKYSSQKYLLVLCSQFCEDLVNLTR